VRRIASHRAGVDSLKLTLDFLTARARQCGRARNLKRQGQPADGNANARVGGLGMAMLLATAGLRCAGAFHRPHRYFHRSPITSRQPARTRKRARFIAEAE
jgi:hypothetical protein